ncbi:SHOCT domain-containing protein [Candidatus Accumulibacter sp. ACC003]|uniref:SHOCT domain-containing protein n=1 Tax=Candidatus Accumulibacter sp. ACC003 TaxID=2823334 RepID=UPI0025C70553|nr:SHOCT domain-containing protein [Candidatus Accumulibacter sp. ACC003]
MRQLSPSGQQAIDDIAQRHGFSANAVLSMLESVINGNGSMAQFSHPEFSGSGQWMRGGMIMVSNLFDNHLKGRIDALCNELATLVAQQPDLIRSGSFQSQSQGGQGAWNTGQEQASFGGAQQHGSASVGPVSLFVPPAPGTSGDWWPGDLRHPNSTGAQNGVRYAHFAQARRLAIDVGGTVTVYDTLDHQIGGFSQQQSIGGTLSFSSQHGLIDVASLPVLSSTGQAAKAPSPSLPATAATPSTAPEAPRYQSVPQDTTPPPARDQDIFAVIERLADLRAKGIVSDEEFSAKKTELLSRL